MTLDGSLKAFNEAALAYSRSTSSIGDGGLKYRHCGTEQRGCEFMFAAKLVGVEYHIYTVLSLSQSCLPLSSALVYRAYKEVLA